MLACTTLLPLSVAITHHHFCVYAMAHAVKEEGRDEGLLDEGAAAAAPWRDESHINNVKEEDEADDIDPAGTSSCGKAPAVGKTAVRTPPQPPQPPPPKPMHWPPTPPPPVRAKEQYRGGCQPFWQGHPCQVPMQPAVWQPQWQGQGPLLQAHVPMMGVGVPAMQPPVRLPTPPTQPPPVHLLFQAHSLPVPPPPKCPPPDAPAMGPPPPPPKDAEQTQAPSGPRPKPSQAPSLRKQQPRPTSGARAREVPEMPDGPAAAFVGPPEMYLTKEQTQELHANPGYQASVAGLLVAEARVRELERYMEAGRDQRAQVETALALLEEPELPVVPPGRARSSAPYSIAGVGLTDPRQEARHPSSSHDGVDDASHPSTSPTVNDHQARDVKST